MTPLFVERNTRRFIIYFAAACLAGLGPGRPVAAQGITMKETLDYLNGKLGSCCSVDVIRGVLVAAYRDDGQVVREDQVAVGDLDLAGMTYESGMFAITCKGAPSKKCVSRDLPLLDVYRSYSRISWPVTLPPAGVDGMKKAFTHLIRMVTDRKYESDEPFE
jgi:hypothetical protein